MQSNDDLEALSKIIEVAANTAATSRIKDNNQVALNHLYPKIAKVSASCNSRIKGITFC
jgi:hypothetical protein